MQHSIEDNIQDFELLRRCHKAMLVDDAVHLRNITKDTPVPEAYVRRLIIKCLVDKKLKCFEHLINLYQEVSEICWQQQKYTYLFLAQRECDFNEIDIFQSVIDEEFVSSEKITRGVIKEARKFKTKEELCDILGKCPSNLALDEKENTANGGNSHETLLELWFMAAAEGNCEWLKVLLECGFDINTANVQENGATALQIVSAHTYFKCVEFLLQNNADFTKHLAANTLPQPVVCLRTMPAGMPPSIQGLRNPKWELTPLVLACSAVDIKYEHQGCLECLRLLVPAMRIACSPDVFQEEISKALLYACGYSETSADVVKYLVEQGANVDFIYEKIHFNGKTPLCAVFERSRANCLEVATLLLDAGAAVNGVQDSIPLYSCWKADDIMFLLKYKPDINKTNSLGETPLMNLISKKNSYRGVKLLLEYGQENGIRIDLNHKSSKGISPLLRAQRSCATNVTRLLLSLGASPNIRLNWSSVRQTEPHISIMKEHIRYGATIIDAKGNPLAMVLNNGKALFAEMMMAAVASHRMLKIVEQNTHAGILETILPDSAILEVISNPFKLKHLARDAIRRQLSNMCNIDKLPVPELIRVYLWYPELTLK